MTTIITPVKAATFLSDIQSGFTFTGTISTMIGSRFQAAVSVSADGADQTEKVVASGFDAYIGVNRRSFFEKLQVRVPFKRQQIAIIEIKSRGSYALPQAIAADNPGHGHCGVENYAISACPAKNEPGFTIPGDYDR